METESQQWCNALRIRSDAKPLDICRAFERTASTLLAPTDLAAWPFYAMPTSVLPPKFLEASRHCGGWFNHLSYFWLREYLPNDRGPGLAVVVNDVRTPEDAHNLARAAQSLYAAQGEVVSIEELLEFVPPMDTVSAICRILNHELAHLLDCLASGEWQDWIETFGDVIWRPSVVAGVARRFDELASCRDRQEVVPPPNLDQHGLRFTRIVCHLDYRLRRAGVYMERPLSTEFYGQLPYSRCYSALQKEMAAYCQKGFRQIISLSLPPAFAKCDATAA